MHDAADDCLYCPDCHKATVAVLDHATGDTICTDCALVLDSHYIDETSEWRTFASDGGDEREPCRVGAAVNPFLDRGGSSLGTSISFAGARKINTGVGALMPRMLSVGSAPDKVLVTAFRDIAHMADRLGLVATVKDRAKEVFKKLEERKVWPRGRSKDSVYAACLFIACRDGGHPRTLKELSPGGGGAAKKDVGKLVMLIKKHLGDKAGQMMNVGVVRAADYLRRFCSLLRMANREVRMAQEAARRLEAGFDLRRNPESVAAAVIYMAAQRSGAKKSAKEVSMATGVAEGTIREAYKDLAPYAEQLFA